MPEPEPLTRSFNRYLRVLRRQWWVTVIVTIAALAIAAFYVATATPVYSASSKIVVGQNKNLFNPSLSIDYTALTSTISNLLQSNVVARKTIDQLHLKTTPTSLLSNLSVNELPDGAVITASYNDTNQPQAVRILGTIDSIFTQLLNSKLSNAGTGTTAASSATASQQPVIATVFDPAHADPGKVSPHVTRSIVIALLLGLVLGILLAFIRDALSNAITSEEEAERAYGGITSLGSLPGDLLGKSVAQLASVPTLKRMRAIEAVRMLALRLRYSTDLERGVIVVVGAEAGEGKSTVAGHLAAELARAGSDVIAVEADLRRPALHRMLGVAPARPGLTELGASGGALSTMLVPAEDIVTEHAVRHKSTRAAAAADGGTRGRPRVVNEEVDVPPPGELRLLPAGAQGVAAASDALTAGKVSSLMLRLRALADYVVVDTPPLLLVADAYPFIQAADVIVVVARQGQTRENNAVRAAETLRGLGAQQVVLAVTDTHEQSETTYYQPAA